VAGLMMPLTLPHDLPPLRLSLGWDNLTGHKTPDLALWLCAHGLMPLDRLVGGWSLLLLPPTRIGSATL
jgi:hypothetical protein